ncbi:B12-binding domain-containing radical SAM protein [Candidatus Pacearchaeota archaeon]|nr:B12-binding domain-containing radical SAM protein [Candidatus Pacearchaeota archaeon]
MKKFTKENIKIRLTEPPPTLFGKLNGGEVYDEFSKARLPDRATPTIEANIRNSGYKNVKTVHAKKGVYSKKDMYDMFNSDVLLIGYITRTANQSLELIKLSRRKNPQQLIIVGGPHSTFTPREAINAGANIEVGREGEIVIREILKEYLKKGTISNNITPIRKLLTEEELNNLPHPYYDKETRNHANIGVIETTRGCPNNCDFCEVTQFYGGIYRRKSIEWIVKERKRINNMFKGNVYFFTDDNIVGNLDHKNPIVVKKSIDRFRELSYAFRKNGFNKSFNIAQITSKGAYFPEVIEGLKELGIDMLCIGLESMNPETLKELGKPYSVCENQDAVIIYRKSGLRVHGMIMIGPKDGRSYIKWLSKWINNNLDSVQIFPVVDLPGTKFSKRMSEEGRILSSKYYLRDGHHVVIKPDKNLPKNERMTAYEQQIEIVKMYKKFYSFKNSFKRFIRAKHKKVSLGLLLYTLFGGVRKIANSKQSKAHLKFLKRLDGF